MGSCGTPIIGSSIRLKWQSFEVKLLGSEYQTEKEPAAGHLLRTFGTYRVSFKPEINGRQLIVFRDRLSALLPENSDVSYNYIGLGLAGSVVSPEKLDALQEFIANSPLLKENCHMFLRSELADQGTVGFIKQVSYGLRVVGLFMVLAGIWSYFIARLRFAGIVDENWQKFKMLGAKNGRWFAIHMGFFLIIVLFSIIVFSGMSYISGLMLENVRMLKEVTRYLLPASRDFGETILILVVFILSE